MSESLSTSVAAPGGAPKLSISWQRFALLAALGGLVLLSGNRASSAGGKPEIDPSYADGQTYYMIGPHLIVGANPTLYAHAEELYLMVYPLNPNGSATLGPQTLPSGYQPQCDPCFHPGLPLQFAYHDHVLTGAPGLGNNGTAGQYKGPWKIILLVYNPAVIMNKTFTPIKSAADIDAAEANGEFLPINTSPGPGNPYEINTGNVLICPLVSPHA